MKSSDDPWLVIIYGAGAAALIGMEHGLAMFVATLFLIAALKS